MRKIYLSILSVFFISFLFSGCKSGNIKSKKYLEYRPYFNQLEATVKSKQLPSNKKLDTLVIIHSNLRIKNEFISDSSTFQSMVNVGMGELLIDIDLINEKAAVYDTFYYVSNYLYHMDMLEVMRMEVEANPKFIEDSKIELEHLAAIRKDLKPLPTHYKTKVYFNESNHFLLDLPVWFAESLMEGELKPKFSKSFLQKEKEKQFLTSTEMADELKLDNIQLSKLTSYILGDIPWFKGDSIPFFPGIETVYFDSLLVINFDTVRVLNTELTKEVLMYPMDSLTTEGADSILLIEGFSVSEQVDYTIFYPDEQDVYIDMIRVEGGEFTMGANLYDEDERPAMPVKVNRFLLSKYEVTNEQFSYFMNDQNVNLQGYRDHQKIINLNNQYTKIYFDKKDSIFKSVQGYENYPVVNVTWLGAQRFCQVVEGSSRRGRLPSEAEWEFAARGGRYAKMHYTDAQKKNFDYDYLYSGGNYLPGLGTFIENSYGYCHLVGRYAPNEIGINDMSGNVWEWCYDKYDKGYYKRIPRSNPINNSGNNIRSNRGGSWSSDAMYCRVTNRNFLRQDEANAYLGFRLYKKW